MKKYNICGIVWKAGIYIILLSILYLVVIYKVQWENKDLNTYMYIYNCNENICTSTIKQDNYYNKVKCENDTCPYITDIIDNILILRKDNKSWLYNYVTNEIINEEYLDYRFLDNDLFVVTNDTNKQGIINRAGELLIKPEYEYIDGYKNGYVSYKQNNLCGITTPENINDVEPSFEAIDLINDSIFAARNNNIYNIYNYKNTSKTNDNDYTYIYSYRDVILVINNKKIDIITVDLNSTLIMKINTFYEYKTEKERASLNIHSENDILYFDVFTSETEYTTYKYNVATKKII